MVTFAPRRGSLYRERGEIPPDMHHCPLCKEIAPFTHPRDTPIRCGFKGSGVFRSDNWNCGALNELRQIAEDEGYVVRSAGDVVCYAIPIDDHPEDWSHIILVGYKDRGRVGTALALDDTGRVQPLEEKIAFSAIHRWYARGDGGCGARDA